MSKPMNKAEKTQAAIDRAEEVISDLIQQAEHYGRGVVDGISLWDQRCRRRDLLKVARRYGRAMQRISQVRV